MILEQGNKMNEKIKELAEQAGFIAWEDEPWNPGDVFDWSSVYDSELEKFARLIQERCAAIAMSYSNASSFDSYDELDSYDRGCDDTAALIASQIKNIFRSA